MRSDGFRTSRGALLLVLAALVMGCASHRNAEDVRLVDYEGLQRALIADVEIAVCVATSEEGCTATLSELECAAKGSQLQARCRFDAQIVTASEKVFSLHGYGVRAGWTDRIVDEYGAHYSMWVIDSPPIARSRLVSEPLAELEYGIRALTSAEAAQLETDLAAAAAARRLCISYEPDVGFDAATLRRIRDGSATPEEMTRFRQLEAMVSAGLSTRRERSKGDETTVLYQPTTQTRRASGYQTEPNVYDLGALCFARQDVRRVLETSLLSVRSGCFPSALTVRYLYGWRIDEEARLWATHPDMRAAFPVLSDFEKATQYPTDTMRLQYREGGPFQRYTYDHIHSACSRIDVSRMRRP